MRRIVRWLVVASFALALLLPATGFADDKKDALYDCADPVCTDWAPKGENTCRTCKTMQCRKHKQTGKDEFAAEKTKNQCYQGHGDPPSDEELKD